jgi:cell shape-determining protein MreC
VRLSLSVLAHPCSRWRPCRARRSGAIGEYFASQERLLRENQALKAKVLEQSAAAQEARLLKAERRTCSR